MPWALGAQVQKRVCFHAKVDAFSWYKGLCFRTAQHDVEVFDHTFTSILMTFQDVNEELCCSFAAVFFSRVPVGGSRSRCKPQIA